MFSSFYSFVFFQMYYLGYLKQLIKKCLKKKNLNKLQFYFYPAFSFLVSMKDSEVLNLLFDICLCFLPDRGSALFTIIPILIMVKL